MNLYNVVHGENKFANILLASLGFSSKTEIPKYRDCWYDGKFIVVYTRTGSGNRDYYDSEESCREHYPADFMMPEKEPPKGPWNSELRNNSYYLEDEDDDFDSTYAKFYFTVPNSIKDLIPDIEVQSLSTRQRWEDFMEKLKEPDSKDPQVLRAIEAISPTFENIAQVIRE